MSPPDEGWGGMRLPRAEPRSGARRTDTGKPRDRQPLKHRALRPAPIHPELVPRLRHGIKGSTSRPGPGCSPRRERSEAVGRERERPLTVFMQVRGRSGGVAGAGFEPA